MLQGSGVFLKDLLLTPTKRWDSDFSHRYPISGFGFRLPVFLITVVFAVYVCQKSLRGGLWQGFR